MELSYSVLLFSNYSAVCKRIMGMIEQSSIDFTRLFKMTPFCIDNPKVRERVVKDKNLQISVVPCILLVYNNGGVEKYDGPNAFKWVEAMLAQYTPVPPPQPVRSMPVPTPPQEVVEQEEELDDRQREIMKHQMELQKRKMQAIKKEEDNRLASMKRQPSQRQKIPDNMMIDVIEFEEQGGEMQGTPIQALEGNNQPNDRTDEANVDRVQQIVQKVQQKVPARMRPIQKEPDNEDILADRHRSVKAPSVMRSGANSYEQNDDLFSGEMMDNRREPNNTIRPGNAARPVNDAAGTIARAKQIAMDRDSIESQTPPSGRPSDYRRVI